MIKRDKGFWYYNLRLTYKIKQWIIKKVKLIKKLKYLLLAFVIILLTNVIFNKIVTYKLRKKVSSQKTLLVSAKRYYKYLETELKSEQQKREVDIRLIHDKVNNLHGFLKRYYPGYDYRNKIDTVLYENGNIDDLPENLLSIVVNKKYLEPHGLKNYNKTLPDMEWPMDVNTSFVATNRSEYASYRPYSLYNYQHEGLDMNNFYNDSVMAVYDGFVYKKYYDEGGGWSLIIKFQYILPNNKKGWYFVRYRHLQKIFVEVGDKVAKGELVASMGNTGYFSAGKHLHFSLWRWNGKKYININPVLNSTWNNKYVEKLKY